jgi:hypothetical protein
MNECDRVGVVATPPENNVSPSVETLPPSWRSTRSQPRGRAVRIALMAVLGVAVMWAVTIGLRGPSLVNRITIDNPSEYDIHIDVREPGSSARLPVGVANQRCVTSFESVIDQGSVWVVEFRAQDLDGGRLTLDRSQLERDNWTIRVPTAVVESLRQTAVPPPRLPTCNS